MSTFSGGGGDLVSSTIPAAFLEALILLQLAEAQTALNLPSLANSTVSLSFDFLKHRVIISCLIPTLPQLNKNTGQLELIGLPYLGFPYSQFDPGNNGSITSTNKADAVLSIAQLLHSLERSTASEAYWLTQITIDDNGSAHITGSLPIEKQFTPNGGTKLVVMDYLL